MFLTKLSIRRPVAILMIIATLVLSGIISFMSIPTDLFPKTENPNVLIQTEYIGANPQQIESTIIKPIEKQLSSIININSIRSYASEGSGYIILELNSGVSYETVINNVKERIDALFNDLPEEAARPVISKYHGRNQSLISLAVTSPKSAEELKLITENNIRQRLLSIKGISQISICGGVEREIQVNLKKHRMDGFKLSVQSVAAAISLQASDISSGHVSGNRRGYNIKVQGQFENIDQIRNIGISVDGGKIPLYTIADVIDTHKEMHETARLNFRSCIGLSIVKENEVSAVQISKSVLEAVEKINSEFTDGTVISIVNDKTRIFRFMLNGLQKNILLVVGLIIVLLFIFSGDFKLTIITALSIFASIIMTFAGLKVFGMSLNLITLMAIELSFGVLVTCAVVVIDNIIKKRNDGISIKDACFCGVTEVTSTILAPVLLSVAVLIPVINRTSIAGQYLKASILIFAMTFFVSLFLAFTLIPAMVSILIKKNNVNNEKRDGNKSFFTPLFITYSKILQLTIRFRVAVVILTFAFMVLTYRYVMPVPGNVFFPYPDEGVISIGVEMPSGYSIKETDRVVADIEKRLSLIPELKSIYSSFGGRNKVDRSTNLADLIINLKDEDECIRTKSVITDDISLLLSDIPDAKIMVKDINGIGSKNQDSDISIEISGNDISEVLRIADTVKLLAQNIPDLSDIEILSGKISKNEIKIVPDRYLLDKYGIDVMSLADNIKNSVSGKECAIFNDERGKCAVKVLYDNKEINSKNAIGNISVVTSGSVIPAKLLGEIKYHESPKNIIRKDCKPMVTVIANVTKGQVSKKISGLKELTGKIDIPYGCDISFSQSQEMICESSMKTVYVIVLMIILVYMVLAACLESILLPLPIMIFLPISFIGVIWALYVSGQSFSIISLIVLVAAGITAASNAILIIDYARKRQVGGLSGIESIKEACDNKSRAVVITNIVIIFSLIPQALTGTGIEGSLALSAIGAVTGSMIMNLFVIPAACVIAMGSGHKSKIQK